MELFGFEIKRRIDKGKQQPEEEKVLKSFVPPTDPDEGIATIAEGGYYGQYYDIDGTDSGNDRELITKYRASAEHPECDTAIDDIINESIVCDMGQPVEVNLDDLPYEDEVKKKIQNEFDHILKLYNFGQYGSEYFRKWYIDGRIYFHIVVDSNNPKAGIQELRYIDPVHMKKVREVKSEHDKLSGVKLQETIDEYFVYSETEYMGDIIGASGANQLEGVKVAPEAIIYVTSGIMDSTRKRVLGHLHKSMKLVNQLRMLEDSLVVYRVSRAPERRIFYIDVGNLPKGKAEEYVRNMMSQYRNKIVYDSASGEVRDDRRHKAMLEDFWLPRREGTRGTEITTLPGGQNLGEIDDILFFQKKLYKSLNVPLSRLDSESGFQIGRATEINREEVKFQKFIDRLRKRFSYVLLDALKTQLVLKGIIVEDDWDLMREDITINFMQDNYFSELKEFEIMKERIDMVSNYRDLIEEGLYSKEWVRKNILKQTDEDIEIMDKQIADEKSDTEGDEPDNQFSSVQHKSLEDEMDGGELEKDLESSKTLEQDML